MSNVIEFKRKVQPEQKPETPKREPHYVVLDGVKHAKRIGVKKFDFFDCQALRHPRLISGSVPKDYMWVFNVSSRLRKWGKAEEYKPFMEALAEKAKEAILDSDGKAYFSEGLVQWFAEILEVAEGWEYDPETNTMWWG